MGILKLLLEIWRIDAEPFAQIYAIFAEEWVFEEGEGQVNEQEEKKENAIEEIHLTGRPSSIPGQPGRPLYPFVRISSYDRFPD